MSISEKLAKMRGGGHHVPVGLDEILEDLDKRVEALEPKQAKTPASKPSDFDELNPTKSI